MERSQPQPNAIKREKTAKDRAYREKLEIETKVLKVLKVSPEEVRQNLVKAKKSDIEVHRQALEQTQDEVEDHLVFITSLQLLNKAMRNRDLKKMRAQESVMQMFATKCLSTIYAWMLSSFFYEMIQRFLAALDPSFDHEDAAKDRALAGYGIYGLLAWSIVPVLQYKIREIDDPKSKYSRLHAAVDLQAKAFPMVLAWSFKDVVQQFLAWADQVLWDEILTGVVLIVVVCALTHYKPIADAKGALADGRNTLKNRYLALPYNMMLGLGWVINAVASFLVKRLNEYAWPDLPLAARSVLQLVFQLTYFAIMSISVLRLDAYYHLKRREQEMWEDQDLTDVTDIEIRRFEVELLANNLGDTLTHALAFVYGWGVSDLLNVLYYAFFMGCGSYSQCPYQQVWYYGILVTVVLGWYIKTLSLQEYRSLASKSYRSFMITAMSLTVGWAWMNVCQVTTDSFVNAWNSVRPSIWTKPLCYLFMAIFVYIVMVEIYYQILDELRYIKRERDEFHEAYPTVPDSGSRVGSFGIGLSSEATLPRDPEVPNDENSPKPPETSQRHVGI